MTDFRYGPIEMYLVGYAGDGPDAATFSALADLVEKGLVRLVDLVVIARGLDGSVDVVEVDDPHAFGFDGRDLDASGIVADDDIADLAEAIPAGTAAVLLVVELVYARDLAQRVAASGGAVLRVERIPAPVVNAVVDLAALAREAAAEPVTA